MASGALSGTYKQSDGCGLPPGSTKKYPMGKIHHEDVSKPTMLGIPRRCMGATPKMVGLTQENPWVFFY